MTQPLPPELKTAGALIEEAEAILRRTAMAGNVDEASERRLGEIYAQLEILLPED